MEKITDVTTETQITPRIQTTLGELIEAIIQVTEKAGKTKEECYELASLALENVLRRAQSRKLKAN